MLSGGSGIDVQEILISRLVGPRSVEDCSPPDLVPVEEIVHYIAGDLGDSMQHNKGIMEDW